VDFHYGPGGGPLLDLGPYYVTAMVVLMGPVARVSGIARASFPSRVVPSGPRAGERIVVHVPTHATGTIEFESGVLATLVASWDIWATNLPYLEIYGSEGSISIANPDRFDGAPRIRRAGAEELAQPPPPPGSLAWSEVPPAFATDIGRGVGVADMAYAIRGGREHRANGELGRHVLEVLVAIERSSTERRHVDIESTCKRPAPLPLGLPPGELDLVSNL